MIGRIGFVFSVVAFLLLAFVRSASAQTEIPPAPVEGSGTGEIFGTIINRTPGGYVPAGLSTMLHAWDQQQREKLMLHGQSTEDGRFIFEDIAFEPGVYYSAMVSYEDAAYFSDPVQVEPKQTSIRLEVPIYEKTDDLSQARIEQMHVLFYFDQGGLAVGEVYSLSNLGDKTIQGAVSLEDGTPATIRFPLPEAASNIQFNDNSGRFLQFPGAYVDTAPLVPGENSSQAMVTYVMPYESSLSYSYTAPVPVRRVSFLFPRDSGLSLEGESLKPAGERQMQDGTTFSVFSIDGPKAGETIEVALSGKIGTAAAGGDFLAPRNSSWGIGIGATAIGLALIILGIWWWRKPGYQNEVVLAPEEEFASILTEIALLDQDYERGEIEEVAYRDQRLHLLQQAKAAAQTAEE